jgi:hypothetical protein
MTSGCMSGDINNRVDDAMDGTRVRWCMR